MTDYLNPHRIYPDCPSRRIDNPPGNDSIRQGGGVARQTAEQFLNSLRHLEYEVSAMETTRARLMDQRQDILDRANSTAALNGVCVQHPLQSKTESLGLELAGLPTPEELVRKLNRLQDRVNKRIDTLVDKKEQAQVVIERIPDARERALLTFRYINNLKWSSVADLMGYTINWVVNDLKPRAIDSYERADKTTT